MRSAGTEWGIKEFGELEKKKKIWVQIQIASQLTYVSCVALVNFKWVIVRKNIQHRELTQKVAIIVLEMFSCNVDIRIIVEWIKYDIITPKSVSQSWCFLYKPVIGLFCSAVLCLVSFMLKENSPRLVTLNQRWFCPP